MVHMHESMGYSLYIANVKYILVNKSVIHSIPNTPSACPFLFCLALLWTTPTSSTSDSSSILLVR